MFYQRVCFTKYLYCDQNKDDGLGEGHNTCGRDEIWMKNFGRKSEG